MTKGLIDISNVDAEEALLGSLLIDPNLIKSVQYIIEPKDFCIERNQWIYEAIVDTLEAGEPNDMVTICDKLRIKNRLDQTGGPSYITSLLNKTPTSIHGEYYANIVKQCSRYRQVLNLTGDLARAVYNDDHILYDLKEVTQDIVKNIEKTINDTASTLSLKDPQTLLKSHTRNQWLWYGYIPYQEISSIGGVEGTGKSVILQDLIRRVLNDYPMPDGQSANLKRASILFIDAEDFINDFLDRMNDWQQCDDHTFWHKRNGLQIITYPEKDLLDFSTIRHQQMLAHLVEETEPAWIILDSWQASFLESTFDRHVQQAIQYFKSLIKTFDCALTATMQMNKENADKYQEPMSSAYKGAGTTAYRFRATFGLYRLQLGTDRDEETDPRIMKALRVSGAKHPKRIAFTLESLPPQGFFVKYHDYDELQTLQSEKQLEEEETKELSCEVWLLTYLKEGEYGYRELEQAAKAEGFGQYTFRNIWKYLTSTQEIIPTLQKGKAGNKWVLSSRESR